MAFTAKDVQALREQTGAGMMDCKKALTSSDGDFQKAIEFLREKGLAAAAKKASRIAAEGMVFADVMEDGTGVVIEVNSETDFVAKNDEFKKFVCDLAKIAAAEKPADVEALLACKYLDSGLTVADMQREKILTIGENIQIRRFDIYDNSGLNVAYVHMGGKIGVIVKLDISDNIKTSEGAVEMGKDICMQIAAMRPQWLDRTQVPAGDIEKEKEILKIQAINDGKPEAVAEKIVMGRINKYYEEICLVDQPFVKENKVSVGKHVEETAKTLGGTAKIAKFTRFEKGDGLAKREDNFAEEVANMTK